MKSLILITGGCPYVVEKHLVRIEEAGATAAVASLVDAEPAIAAGESDAEDSEDDLESGNRRRGRRGGRRRSSARAKSGSTASSSD